MNEISPQQLLSQIRALNSELNAITPAGEPAAAPDGFGKLLSTAIESVNETQQRSATLSTEFVSGNSEASLAEVMIATQKADLSFRAMTEVRNKLVSAYQDIMNMPV